MKKSKNKAKVAIMLLLSIAFMLLVQSVSIGAENSIIGVTINGRAVIFADQTPVIVEERTLVPVRGVFEELGFEVDWNPDTRTAILQSADFLVLIPIDSEVFTTNGEEFTLNVPAQIINGRTMLPIRAVLASVGYDVDWDSDTRTVLITSPGAAESGETAVLATPEPTTRPVAPPPPTTIPATTIAPPPTTIAPAPATTEVPVPPPTTIPATTAPPPVVTEPPAPPPTTVAPTPGVNLDATVWLSRTGTRYHRINNCGNMNPATARSMTRRAARASGYQACANCW